MFLSELSVTRAMPPMVQAAIDQLTELVPGLNELFDSLDSVRQYSERLADVQIDAAQRQRQGIIREVCADIARRIWGPRMDPSWLTSDTSPLVVNITDHHQLLNRPYLLSSHIVSHADRIGRSSDILPILVLSCAGVPPNNHLSESGIRLGGERVPLFSVRERESIIHLHPRRRIAPVDRLKTARRWHLFTPAQQRFLETEQQRLAEVTADAQSWNDQVSLAVWDAWPRVFGAALRPRIPGLVYITQEEVVSRCLLRCLHEDMPLTRALFDRGTRRRVLDTFRSLICTWDEDRGRGTHFFWRRRPGTNRSLSLYVEGDLLRPADPRWHHLSVPLSRDGIGELLESGEIYPSLFTIFSFLHFWAGIRPLVGFGSLRYLEDMRRCWTEVLNESSFEDEVERCRAVNTSGLVAAATLFIRQGAQGLHLPDAYDLISHGGVEESELHAALEQRYSDLLHITLPHMYRYHSNRSIPQEDRLAFSWSLQRMASELLLGGTLA